MPGPTQLLPSGIQLHTELPASGDMCHIPVMGLAPCMLPAVAGFLAWALRPCSPVKKGLLSPPPYTEASSSITPSQLLAPTAGYMEATTSHASSTKHALSCCHSNMFPEPLPKQPKAHCLGHNAGMVSACYPMLYPHILKTNKHSAALNSG